MIPIDSTLPSAGVDRENPWPGLAAFTEEISEFFFGREAETQDLFRLVKRENLTILFGQSGLGKSSLLQAGLSPKLRAADFLPVYLRLDHAVQSPALAQQVKGAIAGKIAAKEIDGTSPGGPDQSLWEYFHHKDAEFWTPKNQLATPVLIFDQFEEIFTLGRASDAARARGESFLEQLADLIENRMPAALRQRVNDGSAKSEDYVFDDPCCKILLSLREDYLPELEGLRSRIRSIMQNRMRIRRMNGAQALEVVTRAGGALVEPGVAPWIVHFVSTGGAASENAAPSDHLEELEVEPALLSIFCRELNNKRKRLGHPRISADLLKQSRKGILSDFYQHSVEDLPEQVRIFVEDKLLTASGIRDNCALENALLEPGVTREVLERLVTRRLLRLDDRQGVQRVELTHDVLAAPIRTSREERQHRLALAKAAEREQEARRRLSQTRRRMAVAAVALAVALPLAWYVVHQRSVVQQQAIEAQHREAAMKATEEARADAARNFELAKKTLADYYGLKVQQALQQSPPESLLAEMLLREATDNAAFEHAAIVDLLLPPAPFAAEKSVNLDHPVSRLLYSPDGTLIAALGADGLTLVDAATGAASQWQLPADLAKARIKSAVFQPQTPFLAIRLADAEGDIIVRWNYLQHAESPLRLRLKWPTAAAKNTDTPKAPPSDRSSPAPGPGPTPALSAPQPTVVATFLPMAFHPDGTRLAAVGPDDTVALFDVTETRLTGKPYAEMSPAKTGHPQLEAATRPDDTYYDWSPSKKPAKPVEQPAAHASIESIDFVNQGRCLLVQSRQAVWTAYMSESSLEWRQMQQSGGRSLASYAVSADSTRIHTFINGPKGSTGFAWFFPLYGSIDYPPRVESSTDQHLDSPLAVVASAAYSTDDRWFALAFADQGVRIYSAAGQKPLQTLHDSGAASAFAFRPDALGLVTAGVHGKNEWSLQFWGLGTRINQPSAWIGKGETKEAVSPDGRWISTLVGHPDYWSSNISGVRVYDARTGRFQAQFPFPKDAVFGESVVRDDGRVVYAGLSDSSAAIPDEVILDVGSETRELLRIPEGGSVRSTALSNDGNLFAASFIDGHLAVYDLTGHRPPFMLKAAAAPPPGFDGSSSGNSDPDNMAFSHDHRKLALYFAADHHVEEYDLASGSLLDQFPLPLTDDLNALAYGGDDATLVFSDFTGLVCFDPKARQIVTAFPLNQICNHISIDNANSVCVLPLDEIPVLVRPAREDDISQLQAASRLMLDSHHNAVPVPAAIASRTITPTNDFFVRFWWAAHEANRRLGLLEMRPAFSTSFQALQDAYQPLRSLSGQTAAVRPPVVDEVLGVLPMTAPLAGEIPASDILPRMRYANERPPVEKSVLLRELLAHIPAAAPQRPLALATLSFAYAHNINGMSEGALERVPQTADCYDALKQALALGYADYDQISLEFDILPFRTDPRFSALLLESLPYLKPGVRGRAEALVVTADVLLRLVANSTWQPEDTAKDAAISQAFDLAQQAVAAGYDDFDDLANHFDTADVELDARYPQLLTTLLERTPANSPDLAHVCATVAAAHARRVLGYEWSAAQSTEKSQETTAALTLLNRAIALGFKDWRDISKKFGDDLQADSRFPVSLLSDDDLTALAGRRLALRTRAAYQEALDLIRAAQSRGPLGFEPLYDQGVALSGLERYAEATASLRVAAPESPDDAYGAMAYRDLAGAERHLGGSDLTAALRDVSHAVNIANSDHIASCLAMRARVHFEMDDDEAALADLDRITAENGDDAYSWDWKGSVLLQYPREQYMAQAAAAYTRALDLATDKKDKDPYLQGRALALRYAGRYADALTDLKALRQKDPDNFSVIAETAIVRAAQGHPRDAIPDFTRVLGHWTEDQDYLAARGLARLETGDIESARQDFTAAIRFDDSADRGTIASYLDLICDAPISLGKDAEAQLLAAPGAAKALARLRLRQGRAEDAAPILAAVSKAHPDDAVMQAYAGDFDAAVNAGVRSYQNDGKTAIEAQACAVALLVRSAAPGASATQQASDRARALFYIGRWTAGAGNDWYQLEHNWDFRVLADDAAFKQLIAAQKLPDDKWNRAYERARFFIRACALLKGSAFDESDFCFDAALQELQRARSLGAGADSIASDPAFAELHASSRFADLLKPLPPSK